MTSTLRERILRPRLVEESRCWRQARSQNLKITGRRQRYEALLENYSFDDVQNLTAHACRP
jgi:hypothetical protein